MPVWINEFHYDNSTANDPGEFIEIAGTAGTDLTGWTIVLYNGGGTPTGQSYSTRSLSGTIPDQGNGFGTVFLSYSNIVQNGSPDGIALVNNLGVVVQFLSYEGVMTASNGPAAGMTSTDVGVAETNTTAPGSSLGLVGTGSQYSDFTWAVLSNDTPGGANAGQTFTAVGPVLPTLSISDVTQVETNAGTTTFAFTVSLSAPAGPGGVTFDIATADGTAQDDNPATEDNDYVARSLTGQTIAQGDSTYTFNVTVNGDVSLEPNENFFVNVTNVTGATVADGQGTGTITNDDQPPEPVASIADVAIVEGHSGVSYMVFTVNLSFAPTGPVTIDYATSNGTATAGVDYLAVSGQLSFAATETSKTISVPIVGERVPEITETLVVTLSNASGATIPDATAAGTITNDDGPLYFALAGGAFEQRWTDTSEIDQNDDWSGVDHIVGYLGDYTGDSPTGVDPRTLTAASTLGQVDVIANQNTTGSISGGVGEFQIADPTIGLQGSGSADAPSIVLYMDSTGRSDVRLQASLRDIDGSGDNAVQPINVQYRTDPNGAWINVPGGYFADVTTGGSATQVTALDVILPAGANNAPTLQIRIMTVNAPSNDEWVGIDDIVVSSQQGPPSVSIADAAVFEGTGGTTPISFTVTRSGDTSAASSVDYDLSFAGGGFSADGSDFSSPLTGTVNFAAGETSRTITLDIIADGDPEADEGFTVTLYNPSAGVIGDGSAVGTIVNDDGTPPFVTIADVTQAEGNAGTTTFTFTVTRTGGTGAFTVDYQTTGAGTATEGSDYAGTSGTLSFAAGENSQTFSVTVNGDTAGELAETFAVLLSNPTGFAVIADPSATGTIQNDDILFIHQIQGSSYYSPILAAEGLSSFNTASATTVIIQAVVTAIDNDGNRQGFYLTEEIGHWDSDSLTSEGIFVMTRNDAGVGSAVSGVSVGDLVTVTATVMEYQAFQSMPRTVLNLVSSPIVESTGNTLPILILDAGRPIPNSIMTLETPDLTSATGNTFDATRYALSFWETVEGMLVTVPDMVVADGFVTTSGGQPIFQAYSAVHADADQINSRGGYTIAGDPPLSPPDTPDADDDTIAGGRHLHDGDVNPDIIEIDFSGFAIDAPAGLREQVTMGDPLGDVTGIVEFDFTDRKIFVTGLETGGFVNGVPARETTALGNDDRSLTVATFNVENLDPTDGAARFAALADAIANNLNAPDIISIEEIQDNNGTGTGTTDASLTWQMLVDAVNAAVPGAAYQWVDQAPVNNAEGGQGNGNIRVGFLYNTARVQLGDLPADATIAERRQFTDRIGDGLRDAGDRIQFSDDMIAGEINSGDWSSTRLSLLGEFRFNGNTVFVTANHFTAKGGSGEFWQVNQNLEAGEPQNEGWAKRNQQAQDVYAMLNHIQANAAGVGIVAGGDFNDFYFYRPLEVLTGHVLADGTARSGGARFDNLTLTLAEAERYTYTFDGRSQAIDHVIANALLSATASYDVVHINTGYNAAGTGADASPRLSDHDPALASFDFRGFSEILTGSSGVDVIAGGGGNDRIDGRGGNDHLSGDQGDDILIGGEGEDTLRGGAGDDVYFVDELADMVVEAAGEGRDVVYATGSHWLILAGSEVEVLSAASLTGTGALDLFGNELAQEILGNDGANVIRGGGGADVLVGRAGDDEYWVADARERVIEASGEGRDVVYASVNYVLAGGSHVEVLSAMSLIGTDPLRLTGNELVQVILGNAGDNVIRGGGGADSLAGLGGHDTYFVVDGEQVFELSGQGHDVVYASAHFVLREISEVEVISTVSLAASDAINLTGSSSAQSLLGNAGANVLDGGLGADTLVGYGGADTFAFTTALGGGNVDQILDFSVADDTIALDDAVFAGLAPGALPAGAFVTGGAALDADDRIIYDPASGALYFDADGSGAGAAVHFATVTAGTALTANDFTVI